MPNPFHKQFQDASTRAQEGINKEKNAQLLDKAREPGQMSGLVTRFNSMGDKVASTQLASAKAGGAKVEAEEADRIKIKSRQAVLRSFITDTESLGLTGALDKTARRMGINEDEMDEKDMIALLQGFLDTKPSLALRSIPPELIKIMKLRVR